LDHQPRPLQRDDIPKQLPPEFESEARYIRNMALQWRMDVLESFDVSEVGATIPGVRARTNQLLLPLTLIAQQLEEPSYYKAIVDYVGVYEESALEERKTSVECMLIEAYIRLSDKAAPTCGDIVKEVLSANGGSDPKLEQWLGARKASSILCEHGFRMHRTKRGSAPIIEDRRLAALCQRFGIVTTPSPGSSPDRRLGGDGGGGRVTVELPTVTELTTVQ
jgi:hypothetical protein